MTVPRNTELVPYDYYVPIISAFVVNFIMYSGAQVLRDNSIVDVSWSILFVIPNLVLLLITDNWNPRSILTFVLVCVWALRLALHNLNRRPLAEDYRYA